MYECLAHCLPASAGECACTGHAVEECIHHHEVMWYYAILHWTLVSLKAAKNSIESTGWANKNIRISIHHTDATDVITVLYCPPSIILHSFKMVVSVHKIYTPNHSCWEPGTGLFWCIKTLCLTRQVGKCYYYVPAQPGVTG